MIFYAFMKHGKACLKLGKACFKPFQAWLDLGSSSFRAQCPQAELQAKNLEIWAKNDQNLTKFDSKS